jgi:hypothetical protein
MNKIKTGTERAGGGGDRNAGELTASVVLADNGDYALAKAKGERLARMGVKTIIFPDAEMMQRWELILQALQ